MRHPALVLGLLAPALLALVACSDESAPAPLPEGGIPQAAPPMPAPGAGGMAGLPSGHPPIDGSGGMGGMPGMGGAGSAPPRQPIPESVMPLTWDVPDSWKETPPSSNMRLANYDVGTAGAGPSVQCVVFAGIGGSDDDNLDRWIGFFSQPDGSSSKDKADITKEERDGVAITRMQVSGIFSGGMGGADPVEEPTEWTMLAGIVRNKALDEARGRIFVRLQGPSAIVSAAAADFEAFLASMQPGPAE